MKHKTITTLFLDIGGVLLSNGWGSEQREKAISFFKLDGAELNQRHHLTFDTYEQGKLSLPEYLKRIVFYEPRHFSLQEFTEFMFSQSVPFQETIDFFKFLKNQYQLKVIAVSNEGRELNDYRITEFKLRELFDAFVSSSYVHLRKPDADIFKMAIDISQTHPDHILYIDDRRMFVEVAQSLGMHGMRYEGLEKTRNHLNLYEFQHT
ncbi:MAG: HAD-IA family hydrolase [Saprospiraceae bacterium]|uniref:HAD-IA family hydrolase n=1 Tax=Candidatus Opimibacter skivensis TaxID=2982028 RepID=A0A9D7SWV0_9BACT|nr:HAD-IA family hydrolase [Candidatus Opimibacter skivensis]